MKKLMIVSVVLLSLSLCFQGAEKKPRPFETVKVPPLNPIKNPVFEKTVLDNGLQVYFFEKHELPLISLTAMIRGGGVDESKAGQAELFGEVLRSGGTKSMSGDKVDEFLENIGAEIETYSGDAAVTVRAKMLRENREEVIPLFVEFLVSPAFQEEKIQLAKTQMNSQISRRNDNVNGLARREFMKLVYGADSPYASQLEYADVEALERIDLLRFHDKFFRPEQTIIAVVGDFDTPEMKETFGKLLGGWKNGTIAPAFAVPNIPEPKASVSFIEKNDVEQSTILLGHLGLRLDDPDYPAVNMLSEVLGGGMASRIFTQVRTLKGLAYGAGGYMMPAYDHKGAFYFYTSTKPESTREALQTILDEIKKVRTGKVTDEELTRARDGYMNSFAFEFDSTEKIARRMLLYKFYGYPEKFNEELRGKIEKVTADDILAAAGKHLFDDKLAVLVVGKKEVRDQLGSFGSVGVIDITIPDQPVKEVLPEPTPETMKKGTELLKAAAVKVGEKQLTDLKNFSFECTTTMKTPMGDFSVKQKGLFVFPDKSRVEIESPMGNIEAVVKGSEGYRTMNGRKKVIPESQLKEAKRSLYLSLAGANILRDVISGKLQGQYIGPKEIDSRKAELVVVTIENAPVKLYIAEGMLIGVGTRQNTHEGPKDLVEVYGDFRVVQGLLVPFVRRTFDGGNVSEQTFYSSAALNVEPQAADKEALGLK